MARRRNTSLQALDRKCPSADGKSSILDSGEPPPCSVDSDAMVNSISTLSFNNRPDPPHLGLRRGDTTHRRSGEPRAWGGWTIRSRAPPRPTARGEDRHPKRPLRRRHHLLDAVGWPPTRAYAMYTARSVVPPPSRHRSGRRREREPANRRRRGGSTKWFQEIASLLLLRERGDVQGRL